jgi:16S rRNA (uracil1498-N3)-methyltransferase
VNIILLSKEDFYGPDGAVRLAGRRYDHITGVLKPSIGAELLVGLVGGRIGTGRVTSITGTSVEMKVILKEDPPPSTAMNLVIALPRPIVFKRLLLHISSLGVKKIIVIDSTRVEKSYWKSPALAKETVEEKLLLGLEQAKDTILPEVSFRRDFRRFVKDEFPLVIESSSAYLADPEADTICPSSVSGPVTLVIGPEGGFIPQEIKLLALAGCRPVRLGRRIIRVETAVIAFLGRLMV